MLTLSLILAFLADRLLPDLRQLRDPAPVQRYYLWILAKFPLQGREPWAVPLLLVLPLILLFSLLQSLIDAALWDVFVLLFYMLIVFLCIDSSLLFEQVDACLEPDHPGQTAAEEYGLSLFAAANSAYYSVIFWMLIGGPVILVFYRLVQKLPSFEALPGRQHWLGYIETMVGWLEWMPSILTSFSYMICGNFDAGLKCFRRTEILADDMAQLNQTRLRDVGIAAVSAAEIEDNSVELLKRSHGLVLRALILWILLAALFEVLF